MTITAINILSFDTAAGATPPAAYTADKLLAGLRASMRQTIEQAEAADLECQSLVREALAAKDAEIERLRVEVTRLTRELEWARYDADNWQHQ